MRISIDMKMEDVMSHVQDEGWEAEDGVSMKLTYSGFDVSEMPRKRRHPTPTKQGFDFAMNLLAHGVN